MARQDTTEEWRGFGPTGYKINWERLLPARVQEAGEGGKHVETTVQAVLQEALPHRFGSPRPTDLSRHIVCKIKWAVGEIAVEGAQRVIRLHTLGNETAMAADFLATVIEIAEMLGDEPMEPIFFYYARDHAREDVLERFSFFVVNDDRIVLEQINLHRSSGSGFDPSFLKQAFDSSDAVWLSERFVWAAKVRAWYRRFYEETQTGRLTALRDDVVLHYYVPEFRQRAELLARLSKIANGAKSAGRLLVALLIGLIFILFLAWSRSATRS